MKPYPIPLHVLDQRHAFVGTTGSGKTYAACTAVEQLLAAKMRVVIIDPLGVWYGLRLQRDGQNASEFNVVIFGGERGDLAITENGGSVIGETVATMAESCIVDLSGIGTSAGQRRFMLRFLAGLYDHATREPFHLVIDEADAFAPQRILDKDGDAAKLLGMMETIVRRGRVRGFIPWLITQRPAVISKNVLSQADALVALKLTGTQDRNAVGAWVEGNADPDAVKTMVTGLPTLPRGRAIYWNPGEALLETIQFPEKLTFDSSRTPKRGERRTVALPQPFDIADLRAKLATVEAEAKDNDPKALRQEIAKLKAGGGAVDSEVNKAKLQAEYERGFRAGHVEGHRQGLRETKFALSHWLEGLAIDPPELAAVPAPAQPPTAAAQGPASEARNHEVIGGPVRAVRKVDHLDKTIWVAEVNFIPPVGMNSAARKMLEVIDTNPPVRRTWTQIATLAGLRARGGHFNTGKKALTESGLIREDGGLVTITTPSGRPPVDTSPQKVVELWSGQLSGAAPKILRHLFENGPSTRTAIAKALGMKPTGGHWNTSWKELKDNDIVRMEGDVAHLTELFQ